MTTRTLDIQITIETDTRGGRGFSAWIESGAMQCGYPKRIVKVPDDLGELFGQWMERVREDTEDSRDCTMCAHAKLWEEDGNPCWDCRKYEMTEGGGSPDVAAFRAFYADAMDKAYSPERIGSLCPYFAELEQLNGAA